MTDDTPGETSTGKRKKEEERSELCQQGQRKKIESYDWQQNNTHVTVYFEVGCNVECSTVKLKCGERSCTLKLTDGRYWEGSFFEDVIGEECELHSKPNRIVLKIKKKNANQHWQHLEMAKELEDNVKEIKVRHLEHVKNSWYEKSGNLIVVVIYIRNINKDTLKISFDDQSFSVTFQTRDVGFLKLHPQCSENDYFYWNVNLKGRVIADLCQFQLTQTVLNLSLKKSENNKRWGGLEAPQKESHGVAVPNNTWVPAVKKTEEIKPCVMKGQGDVAVATTVISPNVNNLHSIKKKPTCMVSPLNKKQDMSTPIGLTGLENLGNTCFMNSVIQCIINTQEIRQYFLSDSFQNEINSENPLGTGGKLASAFAILMRTLWSGNHKSYSPSKLKNLISLKANQFTGFAQHDAQEFMAFLLDGLHEDLNRIKEKPYNEVAVEDDSRDDNVVADEAWKLYKKRNDSVVVDLFQGQYKSKLVCPTCSKVSITFDPFLYLSVPLPKKKRSFSVIYFAQDPSKRPVKYYIQLAQTAFAGELFDKLTELTRVASENLRVFEVAKCKIQKTFYRESNLESVNTNTIIFAFEVLDESLIGEPVIEFIVMQRISMPRPVTRCCNCRREAQADAKLKRCTNCYRVGYCNQSCQRSHWSTHKANCKLAPELIGFPFVVSLPASQATYSKLCYMIEAYARFSVDIFQPPVEIKETVSLLDRTSTATSTETTEVQEVQTKKENDNKHREEDDDDDDESLNVVGQSEQMTRAVIGQSQEKVSERSAQPFTICCVNQAGQSLNGAEKVEDRYEEPLCLPSRYLAIDWQNNEKVKNYVLVQSKEIEHERDDEEGSFLADEKSNFTLEQCLQLFTEPEKLAPDEAWYCPRCKEHREATKQMSLWRLPLILIVQLKRFSFKNFILRDKIDKMVEFPIRDLDLSPYYCSAANKENFSPIYDLYAVINHHGTILGGHYTSYARLVYENNTRKSELDWRLFDDSRVCFVPESNVMSSAGYVLFYRRRDVPFLLPDEINLSNDSENCVRNEEEGVVKLGSGDFQRSLAVAPFSDMETVD